MRVFALLDARNALTRNDNCSVLNFFTRFSVDDGDVSYIDGSAGAWLRIRPGRATLASHHRAKRTEKQQHPEMVLCHDQSPPQENRKEGHRERIVAVQDLW